MLETIAKPFLKWAGGKSQLLEELEKLYPSELKEGMVTRYFEPFIGSGAVFLDVAQRYKVGAFYVVDKNEDLILTYRVIQRDVDTLIDFLSRYAKKYLELHDEDKRKYFYEIRSIYNLQRFNINYNKYSENWTPRAAQLIFLNKTCYNGLFRVNKRGDFNVPFGKYKRPHFFDEGNLRKISDILQNTEIVIDDFMALKNKITKRSFVYFDPPYRPISRTSSFTSYSKFDFDDDEQIRLAKFFRYLDARGAKIMLSNSDPQNTDPDDTFFEDLYRGFRINRVLAKRSINCNGDKRGHIFELVITNFS
jgi:DNA adenine methylase